MDQELDQASRKYVFSSYIVFSAFNALSQAPNLDVGKLKHISSQFRVEIGMLLSDLYTIEQVMTETEASDELSRLCDALMEFSRIFHLCEILCLSDDADNYISVILWLQVQLILLYHILSPLCLDLPTDCRLSIISEEYFTIKESAVAFIQRRKFSCIF